MPTKNLSLILGSILCIILTITLFQPGYMDNDSSDQYKQSQTGVYDDWHPVTMSWVWSQVGRVCPGSLCMFSIQVILYWSALAVLLSFITPSQLYRMTFLMLGFFPPAFMMSATVLKDVLMALTLLFGTSLGLVAYHKKSIVWLGLGVIFLGYGLALRHNAVAAVIPLLIFFGYLYTKIRHPLLSGISLAWRSVMIGGISFITLFAAGSALSNAIVDIKKYPYQQIILHDLVGLSLRLKQNLVPAYTAISEQPSMGDLRDVYNSRAIKNLYWPDFTNIHFRILEDHELVNKLTWIWVGTVLEYPRGYLIQRNTVFLSVMGFNRGKNCAPYYYEETTYKPKGYYQIGNNPYSEKPLTDLVFSLVEPLRDGFLFKNWLYLATTGIGSLLALIILKKRRVADSPLMEMLLAVNLSGFLYGNAYFFVATSCDFRMMYWNVIVTLISLPILSSHLLKLNRDNDLT